MDNAVLQLVARPRLHIGLADMGLITQRRGGGIGFAISGPETILEFTKTWTGRPSMIEFDKLDRLAQNDLEIVLKNIQCLLKDRASFRVRLVQACPQHIGLGSKTTLALGLVAGANTLHEMNLSRYEMQTLSGRGGLSGVGVHTFFEGGVIWDGGHSQEGSTDQIALLPSSAGPPRTVPPLLSRFPFPPDWCVALIRDPLETGYSGPSELQFFRKHTPVGAVETLSSLAILYHGVLPALNMCDIGALRRGLRELHQTGFKAVELGARGVRTRSLLTELQTTNDVSLAAGMSSVGPALYTIFRSDDSRQCGIYLQEVCARYCASLQIATGWNQGYEVRYTDDGGPS